MKQILQNLKTGATEVTEVPVPHNGKGALLIRTTCSLVSAGTERMLLDFGKANFIDKARQQPDKVRMVLDKIKTDGLMPTIETVRNKLDQPLPLGYCNVGRVVQTGAAVSGFTTGDRVVSNGKHAEYVSVPVNLCARIPDTVSDEEAAFTVIGAIALQGIRLTAPTLGEAIAVSGLGLIGLMAVQLLRAHGCRVLGLDYDPARLAMAASFGAEVVDLRNCADPVAVAESFSRGRGMDAVLVTAATRSSEPIHQAANMCRKRGRIVLVGVTGLELSRDDFYKKELSFQVSSSYGPGRYDPQYEDHGHDYPVGFVRWTEQRNFEAVLDMMADGRIDVKPLISHRFSVEQAEQAYTVVGGSEPSLGILLSYPAPADLAPTAPTRTISLSPQSDRTGTEPIINFLGAGNYATAVLIPAFGRTGAVLHTIASGAGVSGVHAGKKYGFRQTTTDAASLWSDPQVSAVVITTRHDSHAAFVLEALKAGKHVFVEKPLCLTEEELERIRDAVIDQAGSPMLMVGYNRRFSPLVSRMRTLLNAQPGPKSMIMTVNAGRIPADHWTQDIQTGGGRIIGEACHFIDLLRHLAGHPIIAHQQSRMTGATGDTVTITLTFADGSIGTVHYFANGTKAFPKERLEVFANGQILQLDNFRVLRGFGCHNFKRLALWRQDKGQLACSTAFVNAIRAGSGAPIATEEILEVAAYSIRIAQALRG